jgi:hypothetical protein
MEPVAATKMTLVQGATHSTYTVLWTDESGNPVSLAGARVMARTKSRQGGGERDVTGPIRVVGADGGVFTYRPSEEDVAAAGQFYMQFFAVYEGSVDISLLVDLTIERSIGGGR